jgi:hypothetical protein
MPGCQAPQDVDCLRAERQQLEGRLRKNTTSGDPSLVAKTPDQSDGFATDFCTVAELNFCDNVSGFRFPSGCRTQTRFTCAWLQPVSFAVLLILLPPDRKTIMRSCVTKSAWRPAYFPSPQR